MTIEKTSKDLISVVIPVYGDKRLVKLLYESLIKTFSELETNFEFVLVNDCCPYGSGQEIEKLALADKRVKFIDLSRNFGQHIAIKAGIDNAKGDYLIIMDCDLQDNPKYIKDLYGKAQEGYDIVFAELSKREDSFFKKFLSKSFKFIHNRLSDFSINRTVNNYSIINKTAADEIKKFDAGDFSYGEAISYLGFEIGFITVEKEKRKYGKSGYNLYKGFKLALTSITANSNKPLIFAAYLSLLMFLFCFVLAAKVVLDFYFKGYAVLGWASMMSSLFFIGGLIFGYLGIIGVYIGNIFKEVKGRSLYIIKRKMNL